MAFGYQTAAYPSNFSAAQAPYWAQTPGSQYAPQGVVGSLLTQFGAPAGGLVGGLFGNQGLGQTIGGALSQLGQYLPFSATPGMTAPGMMAPGQVGMAPAGAGPVFTPESIWSTISSVVHKAIPIVQQAIPVATQILPYILASAGPPQAVPQPQFAAQQPQQYAPQGVVGSLLTQLGAPAGSFLGGLFGNQGLGQTIGSTIGQLGHYLPFSAVPGAPGVAAPQQQLDPQSAAVLSLIVATLLQAQQQGQVGAQAGQPPRPTPAGV